MRLRRLFVSVFALLVASAMARGAADPPAPRPLAKLPGPAGTAVAFSRDGKLILTAGGDEARVWNAETLKPVTTPLSHGKDKPVALAALSPDGRAVLTAHGNEAWVWDVTTGNHLHTLRHDARIYAAEFRPDGHGWRLLTSGLDKRTKLWDRIDGRHLLELRHIEVPKFATFTPDGGATLTYAPREGVRLCDVETGKELAQRSQYPVDHSAGDRTRPVAFSADGKTAVSALSEIVVVWRPDDEYAVGSADTRTEALRAEIGAARSVALRPRGDRFAVAGHGGVAVFDITGDGVKRCDAIPILYTRDAGEMSFCTDGTRLLVAGGLNGAEVWDVERGEQVLAITPGRIPDGPVVFGVQGSRVVQVMPVGLPTVAFSPDGRRVAAGFASDGFTGVWEVPEREGP